MKGSSRALVAGLAAAVALAFTACGAGQTSNGDDDLVRTYCDAYKRMSLTCSDDDIEAEYQTCLSKDGPCQVRRTRREVVTAVSACIAEKQCTRAPGGSCTCGFEDECFSRAGNALAASPHRDAYERACRVKLDACGRGATGFSDDYCTGGGWAGLKDDVFDALLPCFDGECRSVAACLRRTMDGICVE